MRWQWLRKLGTQLYLKAPAHMGVSARPHTNIPFLKGYILPFHLLFHLVTFCLCIHPFFFFLLILDCDRQQMSQAAASPIGVFAQRARGQAIWTPRSLWLRHVGALLCGNKHSNEGREQIPRHFSPSSPVWNDAPACLWLMYRHCTLCSRGPFVSINRFFSYHSSSVTFGNVTKPNKCITRLIFITQTECETLTCQKAFFFFLLFF